MCVCAFSVIVVQIVGLAPPMVRTVSLLAILSVVIVVNCEVVTNKG